MKHFQLDYKQWPPPQKRFSERTATLELHCVRCIALAQGEACIQVGLEELSLLDRSQQLQQPKPKRMQSQKANGNTTNICPLARQGNFFGFRCITYCKYCLTVHAHTRACIHCAGFLGNIKLYELTESSFRLTSQDHESPSKDPRPSSTLSVCMWNIPRCRQPSDQPCVRHWAHPWRQPPWRSRRRSLWSWSWAANSQSMFSFQ